jgi:hypothetical protein
MIVGSEGASHGRMRFTVALSGIPASGPTTDVRAGRLRLVCRSRAIDCAWRNASTAWYPGGARETTGRDINDVLLRSRKGRGRRSAVDPSTVRCPPDGPCGQKAAAAPGDRNTPPVRRAIPPRLTIQPVVAGIRLRLRDRERTDPAVAPAPRRIRPHLVGGCASGPG